MPFQQLVVDVEEPQSAVAEAALRSAGAMAVTLAEPPGATLPVLEPGPGETPLWPTVRLSGLFSADIDIAAARVLLTAALAPHTARHLATQALADRVWEREWLHELRPMQFGSRLWICPRESQPPAQAEAVVRLDPGLAFGTGTHATTALCLEWLDGGLRPGSRVLDYGCGSGVLGIAAALLGAGEVLCVDHDPQALTACTANARYNGVSHRVRAARGAPADATFDVVLANILAAPLIELAGSFAVCTRSAGRLILSGLLESQADAVAAAYRPWFDIDRPSGREGWIRLTGTRRSG